VCERLRLVFMELSVCWVVVLGAFARRFFVSGGELEPSPMTMCPVWETELPSSSFQHHFLSFICPLQFLPANPQYIRSTTGLQKGVLHSLGEILFVCVYSVLAWI
jgi:hypothetical protein